MRKFNGKPLELLAPAGNFEIFKAVVQTNCDAIYFGGQQMNMRMIRKGFNFSDEALKEAVEMAHGAGKKAYITVNNLLDSEEVTAAERYLDYLAEIQPDALIVQDFAVINLIEKRKLNLEVHASVMMNVHNLPMLKALREKGVSRAVLSREMTLAEVRYLYDNSDVELEYFTHGDMCVTHGAQCYYSTMLFGMSSNRGRCLKPCRWWFDGQGEKQYPLAVKDLSMYRHLPEMIQAGVTSFKLEGRMRESDFITALINRYGDALDRYIDDPVGFDRETGFNWIYEHRKRDLSTAYAFGNPGISNMNTRDEGTGKFYSTGKMFSTPTEEKTIDADQIEALRTRLSLEEQANFAGESTPVAGNKRAPKLTIRVNRADQALAAFESGADRVYLTADVLEPDRPFTIEAIQALSAVKGACELYLCTPRMMDAVQLEQYAVWLPKVVPLADGLLVTHLGALYAFKDAGLKCVGDFPMNVFNTSAAEFYKAEGAASLTASLELPGKELLRLIEGSVPTEVICYGKLPAMYMSLDLLATDMAEDALIQNEAGQFLIKRDCYGKNHLMTTHDYTLMPILDGIIKAGVSALRIEAQLESPEDIKTLIEIHKKAIEAPETCLKMYYSELLGLKGRKHSFEATRF
jgi:putative protease